MPKISGSWISDEFSWRVSQDNSEELDIQFNFLGKLTKRNALLKVEKRINEGIIPWLRKEDKKWVFDLDLIRKTFPILGGVKLLSGKVLIEPEVEDVNTFAPFSSYSTLVNFVITKNEIIMQQSKKIFLSHKSADKEVVRRYKRALEAIGYEVWMDEQNLNAGDQLERGILKGFEESCAVVFFITENFEDKNYLQTEIDYSIEQSRAKADYFRVITLAFKSKENVVEIPGLLKRFVWKEVNNEIDGLTEIIRALPILATHFEFRHK